LGFNDGSCTGVSTPTRAAGCWLLHLSGYAQQSCYNWFKICQHIWLMVAVQQQTGRLSAGSAVLLCMPGSSQQIDWLSMYYGLCMINHVFI
jgi:hypothetical protein